MKIINLNTPEIPCPGSHHYTSTKFCNGFIQNGYDFIELTSLNNIEEYNSDENIFLLSNHFTTIGDINAVYDIGRKLDKAYFICWHFNFEKKMIENMPFKKYLITGEYYRNEPRSSQQHIDAYKFSMNCKEWLPFVFSSSTHPDDIGKLEKNITYDSCFIGAPYKTSWVSSLNNCFSYYSNSSDIFLSEEEKVSVYLNSRVCLGFHSDPNIENSCVVERVFEGMSYGCVVLSDNKAAEECTNGIVKYVSTFEEVQNYVNLYKNNPDLFTKIQQDGYDYLKKEGTYFHLAQGFIKKFKEIYE